MPSLTVSHSGVTAANPPLNPTGGGPRGEVSGWSIKSARRGDAFFRSVHFEKLDEQGLTGYACTFTLRNLPDTHKVWAQLITILRKRLERRGMVYGLCVTEWQMRGRFSDQAVPHLHLVVFFPKDRLPTYEGCYPQDALRCIWLDVAARYSPELGGQDAKPISDLVGWFRYLAKHATRGAHHYQRSVGTNPVGWLKTGRMWASWGDWPVSSCKSFISDALFFALRRFSTRYQLASARKDLKRSHQRLRGARSHEQQQQALSFIKQSRKRLRYLKQRLQAPNDYARIVPVSDWIPASDVMQWLGYAAIEEEIYNEHTGEIRSAYYLAGEVR